MTRNSLLVIAWLSVFASKANGFSSKGLLSSKRDLRQEVSVFLTPEEERATILSEYLAKSHDEKVLAIRKVELKKNAEIHALKQQLQALSEIQPATKIETAAPVAPSVDSSNLEALSKEELVGIVKQYQTFMSKYVVYAQEQKDKAVNAAEAAVTKMYEERLAQLKGSQGSSAPASITPAPQGSSSPVTTTVKPDDLYLQRNANVAEAAAAGKSRWGAKEVQRAKDVISGRVVTDNTKIQTKSVEHANGAPVKAQQPPKAAVPAPKTPLATPTEGSELYQKRNEHVAAAAAAGKSRWGRKEIERISPNAQSTSASTMPVASSQGSPGSLYQKRNAHVAAAAAAGKSRWGAKEIERVQQSPAIPSSFGTDTYQQRNANVAAAAAAGKSRWGEKEVERIQSPGSTAMASSSMMPLKSSTASSDSLYEQRNAHVAAAAAAGKSRWGAKEIERVQESPVAPSTSASTAPIASSTATPDSLYEQRNAHVAAAAAAGKTRWGEKEVDRIQESPGTSAIPASSKPSGTSKVPYKSSMMPLSSSTASPDSLYQQRSAHVAAAAAAGKSRWGEKEIDRVQQSPVASSTLASTAPIASSTSASTAPIASSSASPDSLYEHRNAHIAAAAAAGKTRWGAKEVERVQMPSATLSVPAITVNGAVNGAINAVNGAISAVNGAINGAVNGAIKTPAAQSSSSAKPVASSMAQPDSVYQQRNVNVGMAAAAGKSRWGEKEIERIHMAPTATTSAAPKKVKAGSENLYEKRSAHVAAAAAAGKSRWGEDEIEKIQGLHP